jgi:hypothetical protein
MFYRIFLRTIFEYGLKQTGRTEIAGGILMLLRYAMMYNRHRHIFITRHTVTIGTRRIIVLSSTVPTVSLSENIVAVSYTVLGMYKFLPPTGRDAFASQLAVGHSDNLTFFFIWIVGDGIQVHSTLRPLNDLLYQPRVIMIMEKSVE